MPPMFTVLVAARRNGFSRDWHGLPVQILAAILIATMSAAPALPQTVPSGAPTPKGAEQGTPEPEEVIPAEYARAANPVRRLPMAQTTHHELTLGDRHLAFSATAGAITLTDPQDRPEADIAFVAYRLDGSDPDRRPVTFVVNGGPGASSAYLHLGALGPWLVPIDVNRIVPSQPVERIANPDTWLAFTDLVFVDPVGTGFSRLVDPDDRLRGRYLSIDGDADALSDFILRWLTDNDRLRAPKFFVGESYGGFRGPLVAERLQTDLGVALSGLILVSSVLDFGWWLQPEHAPLPTASLLPSLAATAMEAEGGFDPEQLKAIEDYADGPYVTDFLQGLSDEAAVARMVDRVTELTGLDREIVARADGRVDMDLFAREVFRDAGRSASIYDGTVAGTDPFPASPGRRSADPVLDALTTPLTGAVLAHYRDTLDWLPDRRYLLLNAGVSQAWDWSEGRGQPEVVGALRRTLALDPGLRVLVVHGYTDLITPYFASELILRQLPADMQDRVQIQTYRGGHMFYMREDSRSALRRDARSLYFPHANESVPVR